MAYQVIGVGVDDNMFWQMVEECHVASHGDMASKDRLIEATIRRLSGEDALAFYQLFERSMDAAFTWPLWGAAYVLNGGCSDDCFEDFRASLISRGRVAFGKAIIDPDSLADEDIDIASWFHEGFQYAVAAGVTANIGRRPSRANPLPPSPVGQPWVEAAVHALYPKLAQRRPRDPRLSRSDLDESARGA